MSLGIWTPVIGSCVQVNFPDRLNNFTSKVKQVTLAAGTHMRFTSLGCLPIFVHDAAPTDDTDGFTGVPITSDKDVVLPRAATVWIYSPYENITVHVDVGTLT